MSSPFDNLEKKATSGPAPTENSSAITEVLGLWSRPAPAERRTEVSATDRTTPAAGPGSGMERVNAMLALYDQFQNHIVNPEALTAQTVQAHDQHVRSVEEYVANLTRRLQQLTAPAEGNPERRTIT